MQAAKDSIKEVSEKSAQFLQERNSAVLELQELQKKNEEIQLENYSLKSKKIEDYLLEISAQNKQIEKLNKQLKDKDNKIAIIQQQCKEDLEMLEQIKNIVGLYNN